MLAVFPAYSLALLASRVVTFLFVPGCTRNIRGPAAAPLLLFSLPTPPNDLGPRTDAGSNSVGMEPTPDLGLSDYSIGSGSRAFYPATPPCVNSPPQHGFYLFFNVMWDISPSPVYNGRLGFFSS